MDHQKIKELVDMPRPTNKKELKAFLGMITFLARFLKDLSSIAAPCENCCERTLRGSGATPMTEPSVT